MKMLSDDDLNLKALNDDELARAWDLWFNLAQSTNASDPPYTHGVFTATSGHLRCPGTPFAQNDLRIGTMRTINGDDKND